MAACAGVIFALAGCSAEVVGTRPADVVYTRPIAPGPDYVWIGGDWIWLGGSYQWRAGHWERPRVGRAWHEGHWEGHGNGWRWRRGHW